MKQGHDPYVCRYAHGISRMYFVMCRWGSCSNDVTHFITQIFHVGVDEKFNQICCWQIYRSNSGLAVTKYFTTCQQMHYDHNWFVLEYLRIIDLRYSICSCDRLVFVICYMQSPPARTGLAISMMTSSNGSIFRVTGLLCGEFTGHR